MISLIMAGGKGTRMNTKQEKLLLEYKKPVIMHVVDALKNSNCFSRIIAATSSNSPETEKTLRQSGVEIISVGCLRRSDGVWKNAVDNCLWQKSRQTILKLGRSTTTHGDETNSNRTINLKFQN